MRPTPNRNYAKMDAEKPRTAKERYRRGRAEDSIISDGSVDDS